MSHIFPTNVEFKIMQTLAGASDGLKARQIVERVDLDFGSFHTLAARLRERGFLVVVRDPALPSHFKRGDGHLYKITACGLELVELVRKWRGQ